MFLIVEILSIIATTIGPCENTSAMHHIQVPVPDIFPAICPHIQTIAVNVVVVKLPSIIRTIRPFVFSHAIFLSIDIFSDVACAVRPPFFAWSTLSTLSPGTLEIGTFHKVMIDTLALLLAIEPITLIAIAISHQQPSFTVHQIAFPRALIYAAITLYLYTNAKSFAKAVYLPNIERSGVLDTSECNLFVFNFIQIAVFSSFQVHLLDWLQFIWF